MRQIPDAYWTDAFGAVFAYATRDDVHACCVTWRDEYIVLFHDDLRPLPRVGGRPDTSKMGVAEIVDLDEAVSDMLAPHYASGTPKRPRPRASHVGEAIFGQHLHYGAIYAPGEIIRAGWGRPPRAAAPPLHPPQPSDCAPPVVHTGTLN